MPSKNSQKGCQRQPHLFKGGEMRSLIAVVLFLCLVQATWAQTEPYPKTFTGRGFINNGIGQKCWYKQVYKETDPYFMKKSMKHTTHQDLRVIKFDKPLCMSDNLKELSPDIAKMLNEVAINRLIARWYSGTYVKKDASFDVDNLRPPNPSALGQAKGKCMQSRTYPTKSIAIDYIRHDRAIAGVFHMQNLGGCGK